MQICELERVLWLRKFLKVFLICALTSFCNESFKLKYSHFISIFMFGNEAARVLETFNLIYDSSFRGKLKNANINIKCVLYRAEGTLRMLLNQKAIFIMSTYLLNAAGSYIIPWSSILNERDFFHEREKYRENALTFSSFHIIFVFSSLHPS